jgi:hypothetical protein
MASSTTPGGAGVDGVDKVRENRLRRMAARQGLELRKSRRRDPRALDYGRYWLVIASINGLALGGEWGVSLDEVEDYLTTGGGQAER